MMIRTLMAGAIATIVAPLAAAQGEDSTVPERNVQIIAEMLPGYYDNANQVYFDGRLGVPEDERHDRLTVEIEAVDAAGFGDHTMVATFTDGDDDAGTSRKLFALSPDNEAGLVRMKVYTLADAPPPDAPFFGARRLAGCDMLWRDEAGQFRAVAEEGCAEDGAAREILLSEDAFWIRGSTGPARPHTLERAREFTCYADVPGVGGGRDIPYKRYELGQIWDKGDEAWFTLDDGQEVGIRLQNIRWPINNLDGIFTRHSFVMYVSRREGDEDEEVTYTWTAADAQRIGLNLKWMLVNCFMISNEEIAPFFKDEPKR